MRLFPFVCRIFALVALLGLTCAAHAQEAADDFSVVSAAPAAGLVVVAEAMPAKVAPGGQFEVVVHVTAPVGTHTFPDAAQKPSQPSTLYFLSAGGLQFAPPVWPKGEQHEYKALEMTDVLYKGETLIRIPGKAGQKPGTYVAKGAFKGAYCDDVGQCYMAKEYPWQAEVTVDANVKAVAPAANVASAPPPAARTLEPISFDLPWGKVTVNPNAGGDLALLLLLSAIGGFVLNFMPCVLPVIPIKILGLAQAAGTRNKRLLLGAVMSGGVMTLWLAIGSVLAFTSVLGGTAGLNGYPLVNLGLGLFIVLMAFAATGLFAIRLPQSFYRISPKHDSLAGSFGFGLMTGVFALPCTGPFMGTAAAAVVGAGDATFILAVFGAIGFGMAVPYFVLAANPKWVEKLPRSGPASDVMKNFLGWLMLAGGLYFIQAAITQWAQPDSYFWERAGFMLALLLVVMAGLVLAKGCFGLLRHGSGRVAPALFLAFGLGLAGVAAWQTVVEATTHHIFLRLSDEKTLPLGKGKIVVVDFRSNTCINCDLNEKTVFYTPAGQALLGVANKDPQDAVRYPAAQDVVSYQANIDYGTSNKAYLQRISGTLAVPFLAIYDANGRLVEKMSGTLTTDQLRQGIEKARQQIKSHPK